MKQGLVPQRPLLAFYLSRCEAFKCAPNATIMCVLSTGHTRLQLPPADFKRVDLLPLADVLRHPECGVRDLDLQSCAVGDAGCHVLKEALLANKNTRVTFLHLADCRINLDGCRAIADLVKASRTLEVLDMSFNKLGLAGAQALARALPASRLSRLNMSNTAAKYQGTEALRSAAQRRRAASSNAGKEGRITLQPQDLEIVVEGNFFMEEVANAFTHGLGCLFVLAIAPMMRAAARKCSERHNVALTVYLSSMFSLFLCSTLYHSFYNLSSVYPVFQMLDHAMIYVLIAGSYTPFLAVPLRDTLLSQIALPLVWSLAALGLCLTFLSKATLSGGFGRFIDRWYRVISMTLYVGMGWMVIIFSKPFAETLSPEAIQLLAAGGLSYTTGIYFFQASWAVPAYHVIWHIFVLCGAICHTFAVWDAVLGGPDGCGPRYGGA